MSHNELYLHFVEAILCGGTATSGKGIVGQTARETQLMRAEWMVRVMPLTANLIGVKWDGIKRPGERE